MISFCRLTLIERIRMLWPPYRRQKEAEMGEAIRWLVDHPEAPCVIGDTFIPNGYGTPTTHVPVADAKERA